MEVEVNWLGVVLAALSTMVVGSAWYAKPVFGRTWMKLVKLDEKKASENAVKALSLTLLLSFLTAYVLAHVIYLSYTFFDKSYLESALTTSFWIWLGFVSARLVTHELFENRPAKLALMNIGNEFATLMIMGLVLGLVGL